MDGGIRIRVRVRGRRAGKTVYVTHFFKKKGYFYF